MSAAKAKTLAFLTVVAACCVLLCATASCAHDSSRTSSSAASGETAFLEVEDETVREEPFLVSLGFIGDINFADDYYPMQHLANAGSTNIADGIDPSFIALMNDVDVMWANNEFVYSTSEEPLPGKKYTFRASPSNVSYLSDLGIDIVGLANNHTFDYGAQSFIDTMDTLEGAGIAYVGAGRNDQQAYAPVYKEVDGITIAYVAASSAENTIYTLEATPTEPGIAWCYDNERFLQSVREAAANADFVVVLPHWGVEHSAAFTDEQAEFAHQYIDAGADIVVGAHPHVLQGIESYHGKPIFYSLGNFWFDSYNIFTALVEVRIQGVRLPEGGIKGEPAVTVVVHPGVQYNVFTSWEEGTEAGQRALQGLSDLSVNASIAEDGTVQLG